VRKHSHFQTSLENPSIQTHLVLLCCIKRLWPMMTCVLGRNFRPESEGTELIIITVNGNCWVF